MKIHSSLLPLATLALGLAACAGNNTARQGCAIEGTLAFSEYKTVYLMDEHGTPTDSCEVKDGKFRFEKAQPIEKPYVAILHMAAEGDPTDWMEMPVAIENGTVTVGLDEYIRLEGTPLNARIKAFLDALQHCKDGMDDRTDVTLEEIGELFSAFYKQQILSNKENAVGAYIYRNYGLHLVEKDKAEVKAQMGN